MLTTVEQLQAKMKKDRISVPKLSKDLEIPQDRIYSWFRGKGNPKSEDAKKVEEFLGIGTNTNLTDQYQAEYLAIIRNCSEAARDAASAAKESAYAVNKLIPANSAGHESPSVDRLAEELAVERLGVMALTQMTLERFARQEGKSYDQLYNDEFCRIVGELEGSIEPQNKNHEKDTKGRTVAVEQA